MRPRRFASRHHGAAELVGFEAVGEVAGVARRVWDMVAMEKPCRAMV